MATLSDLSKKKLYRITRLVGDATVNNSLSWLGTTASVARKDRLDPESLAALSASVTQDVTDEKVLSLFDGRIEQEPFRRVRSFSYGKKGSPKGFHYYHAEGQGYLLDEATDPPLTLYRVLNPTVGCQVMFVDSKDQSKVAYVVAPYDEPAWQEALDKRDVDALMLAMEART